ncbi:MAG: flagellar export chaperone FlgN [Planctomycetota bacterium]|jgi:hypothetical protein
MVASKIQVLEELNAFLDEETSHVEATLLRLDMLRAAVVRRDEGALEELLSEVQLETQRKKQSELAQERLKLKLSGILACRPAEVNISRLCRHLEEPDREAMQSKQAKLQQLVRRLQNEHEATNRLLRECARFNRLLLSSIIGNKNQSTTYNAKGQGQWSMQRGLMNMKM